MIQIKKFSPQDHKIKAVIYGASGAGKTVFGGTGPKPIFASAEGGLLSIADKNPDFVEIKCLKDLIELLDYLKKGGHGFETLIIDSISEINDIIKTEIEKRTGRSMQIQDWGTLSKEIRKILRGFRDLPMNVIFLAQENTIKDEEKIDKVVPSLNGKTATEIAYFMDIVGYIFVDKDGSHKIITGSNKRYLTKDRSNLILNDTEPNLTVWINKIKGIKLILLSENQDKEINELFTELGEKAIKAKEKTLLQIFNKTKQEELTEMEADKLINLLKQKIGPRPEPLPDDNWKKEDKKKEEISKKGEEIFSEKTK